MPFWEKYLEDLENVPGLTAEERPLAMALVCDAPWELYLDVVEDLSEDDGMIPTIR